MVVVEHAATLVIHGFLENPEDSLILIHAPNRVLSPSHVDVEDSPESQRRGSETSTRRISAENSVRRPSAGGKATFDAKSAAVWMVYDDLWVYKFGINFGQL